MFKLSIIVPCYNEGENIPSLYDKINTVCAPYDWELLLVDDGSTDGTRGAVEKLRAQNPRVHVISFVKNYGHQAALRAGLRAAQGDYIVSMDADLQHPPEAIPAMIEKAREGFSIINMVHDDKQPGFLKDFYSRAFYRVFSIATGVRFDYRASDFRLIDRKVQQVINMLPERGLFLRALLLHLGFPLTTLKYHLQPRFRGRPAYTFGKSLALAINALFSFSTFPIRFLFISGFVIALLAFCYGLVHVVLRIFTDQNLPGFTDIVASVLFLGGINLIMLSVISKYMQVILDQLKQRPEYLIDPTKSDLLDPANRR
jgi:dolichol-phosphate mannosyltransferase